MKRSLFPGIPCSAISVPGDRSRLAPGGIHRLLNRAFWKGRRPGDRSHRVQRWLAFAVVGGALAGNWIRARSPTQPNLFEQAGIAASVHSICTDIRDFSRLRGRDGQCRPEVIIHMAAQSVVRHDYEIL
jgi:CDP-glucose 4,6-dehydratase